MKRCWISGLLLVVSLLFAADVMCAAEIYWDTDATAGIQDGGGTWNTSNTLWTTDGGATRFAWNNTTNAADTAVFGAGGGTGSAAGSNGLTAGGLKVLQNYTFNTWHVNLTAGDIEVAPGVNANIAGLGVQGTAGVTKTGTGTLTFGGAKNFTGGIFLEEGTLKLSGNTSLINPANGTVTMLAGSGSADVKFDVENNAAGWNVENPFVIQSGSAGSALIEYSKASGAGSGEFSGNFTLDNDLTIQRAGSNDVIMAISGDISGAGDLTLRPSETDVLTISGDNSGHTGALNLIRASGGGSSPTVELNGTQGNSNINIENTAVEGTGTLNFNVVDDVSDLISVVGDDWHYPASIDLSGLSLVPILGGTQTQDEYEILTTSGDYASFNGVFASLVDNDPDHDFAIDYDGTDDHPDAVVLQVTTVTAASVPEPSTAFLMFVMTIVTGSIVSVRCRMKK